MKINSKEELDALLEYCKVTPYLNFQMAQFKQENI